MIEPAHASMGKKKHTTTLKDAMNCMKKASQDRQEEPSLHFLLCVKPQLDTIKKMILRM